MVIKGKARAVLRAFLEGCVEGMMVMDDNHPLWNGRVRPHGGRGLGAICGITNNKRAIYYKELIPAKEVYIGDRYSSYQKHSYLQSRGILS